MENITVQGGVTPVDATREVTSAPIAAGPETPSVRDGRLEFLDALRGLAAAAVVLQHTFDYVSERFGEWSSRYFNPGQFGVVTFFLVSGFIIPVSIERSRSLRGFWANRFFRLYPIYWLSLLLAVVLSVTGRLPLSPEFTRHFWQSLLINVTMLQLFLRAPDAIPSYWTLGMELLFYILCSALFLAKGLHRSLLWAWASALGMLVLVLVDGLGFHRSLPAGRLGLLVTAFFGTVLFAVYSKRLEVRVLAGLVPLVIAALLTGFWFRFERYPQGGGSSEGFTFVAVTLTWLTAYAVFGIFFLLRRQEFPKWSIWLGRISYSLYLMQSLILSVVPRMSNPIAVATVNIVGSVGIAAITYPLVEKRFVAIHKERWKKGQKLAQS